ncbi:hypothetical protein [Fluviicola taffensis]|uniref:Class I SAM-dependent methyltransferase n=1 Tax=Fluviicola taffensis (strain DSM 16823 / NCIMB 13979 / RW262) TaxID=755732 RepID=F2IBZ7_FLUTR|nr:hypothetical protein [Fluviicola taffensis]AEA42225.1 hypothetical protein Fluta_0216 [Fluviicola taffensis DSM 16823]
MGVINFGINRPLVEKLAKEFNINNFIETGTYLGGTSSWAATIFKEVHTIEISEEIFNETSNKFKHIKNLHFNLGDSKTVLPQIIPSIKGSAVFWLDGHWCGRNTGGKYNECPIMDELEQASKVKDSVILIDDLRYFLGPNPHDHGENYPTIDSVMRYLMQELPTNFITFHDDTLICAPVAYKKVIDENWLETYSKRFPRSYKSLVSKMWWRIKRGDFNFSK